MPVAPALHHRNEPLSQEKGSTNVEAPHLFKLLRAQLVEAAMKDPRAVDQDIQSAELGAEIFHQFVSALVGL